MELGEFCVGELEEPEESGTYQENRVSRLSDLDLWELAEIRELIGVCLRDFFLS